MNEDQAQESRKILPQFNSNFGQGSVVCGQAVCGLWSVVCGFPGLWSSVRFQKAYTNFGDVLTCNCFFFFYMLLITLLKYFPLKIIFTFLNYFLIKNVFFSVNRKIYLCIFLHIKEETNLRL